MTLKTLLLSSAAAALIAAPAVAKVPAEVAARLGADLTPMGAELAGNAAGTIPAWDGGITAPPPGIRFDPKTQQPPDPFGGDTPKFRITAANMGEHAANLSAGHQALLKTYSSYFMDVYQTRRSCGFPQAVYEASKRNATVGQLNADGNGVTGAIFSSPFPVLSSGLEAVWNHSLANRGGWKFTREFAAAPVQQNGSYNLIVVQDEALLRWSDPSKQRAEDLNNRSIYYIANTIGPARLAGNVILVHESINASAQPRDAWSYNPGTRRVRRAPDIAFDNPGTNTDGMSTSDAFDGYNGSPERYNWMLAGKSEKYIAYNNYKAMNASYADLLKPLHLNQDLVRYELHRVWTVEAKLRPGSRHIYTRRVMHFDEDTLRLAGTELYDGQGNLWRVQELHSANFYHIPVCSVTAEVVYDLQANRYLAGSLRNEQTPANFAADDLSEDRYTPQAIRGMGKR